MILMLLGLSVKGMNAEMEMLIENILSMKLVMITILIAVMAAMRIALS